MIFYLQAIPVIYFINETWFIFNYSKNLRQYNFQRIPRSQVSFIIYKCSFYVLIGCILLDYYYKNLVMKWLWRKKWSMDLKYLAMFRMNKNQLDGFSMQTFSNLLPLIVMINIINLEMYKSHAYSVQVFFKMIKVCLFC